MTKNGGEHAQPQLHVVRHLRVCCPLHSRQPVREVLSKADMVHAVKAEHQLQGAAIEHGRLQEDQIGHESQAGGKRV